MRWRGLASPIVVAAVIAAGGASAAARDTVHSAHHGPLSGAWAGYIGAGSNRQRMAITINARETRGTWRISATCYGTLTLDSISGGYHHFRRHAAGAASCQGGDVDCLKRMGAELYDAVTSHLGGAWDTGGTFKRVRA